MRRPVQPIAGLFTLLALAATAAAAGEEVKRNVSVEHRRKRELFDWAHGDMLKDYREGDTVVLTGHVKTTGYLYHYGHRGILSYPTDGAGMKPGTLVRGRFTVKAMDGKKKLSLLELLDSRETADLLDRAERDYQALLPEIRRVTALKESKLVLKEIPRRDLMSVICPPEGWRTLYIGIRQFDLMYECDVALRYEFTGKDYLLVECCAVQWFKGE